MIRSSACPLRQADPAQFGRHGDRISYTTSRDIIADAARRVREENRLLGRPLPKRAVGSALLLKGLEAEVAVVLNTKNMNVQNLCVAMTRGSMKLVVCSSDPIVG
jgi:hypothetical protein